MKKTLAIYILLTVCATVRMVAQTVSVQVPSQVVCGENFRLSYVVNTQEVEKFRMGEVPEGLEVVSGPYTSRSSSVQFVNGHTTTSSSVTYTYTVYARKNGTYVIPAASATIGGKTVASKEARVTVSGTAAPQGGGRGGAPRMHGQNGADDLAEAGTKVSGEDLFIRVSASKTKVYEQEPVLLTYKVFSQVDLSQLQGKMPDLTGFQALEIPLPQQKSFKVETIDGKTYRTVTWSEYVVYPQMTGKLEIPSITFSGTVIQRTRNIDPFEAFFNGGAAYTEVKRDVKAPAVVIDVEALPTRPAGFSGGVGQFSVNSSVDKTEVKAGEPVTMRFEVKGTGNLKLIKQPVVEWPKDFDVYDPKTTDKTELTRNGLTGSMVYEYLVVPRNQGKYDLPGMVFTYFDPQAGEYKTLETEGVELTVLKGSGRSSVADFTEDSDRDIHGIKTGRSAVESRDEFVLSSGMYRYALGIPLVVFLIVVVVFRKRAIDNANVVRMKGRKANKVATRRLRAAKKLMERGEQGAFYDEVLRALWGYVSDKLNVAVVELSRENVVEQFTAHDVEEGVRDSFVEAIDECEYARYAPGEAQGKMDAVYDKAAGAITKIDEMLSERKRRKSVKASIVLILCLLSVSVGSSAETITKQMADAEYAKGNYQEAIREYEELLKGGVSAELYYNLGNAYFRTERVTQAVLAYERALRLAPSDKDVRFNLQFARARTVDKITPESEAFFVTWYRSVVNVLTSDEWAVVSIGSFLLMLLLLVAYLFAPRVWMIKGGFYGAVVCAVLFALSTWMAVEQKRVVTEKDSAVIVAKEVEVKKTPEEGSETEMTLHEGTRVDVTDRAVKGWTGVKLSDGREGWLRTKAIEDI